MERKSFDDHSLQPLKSLPKASGDSYEVFDNVPSLRRGGWAVAGLSAEAHIKWKF